MQLQRRHFSGRPRDDAMTAPVVQLSRACRHCDGKGYFISGVTLGGDFIAEKVPCPVCHARGIVLTLEAWAQSRAVRWMLPSKRGRT